MVIQDPNDIRYEVIGESKDGKIRQLYWEFAIGLNEVDNLKPSKYFREIVKENINGKYTHEEVGRLIRQHYGTMENKYIDDGEKECDLVATRIYAMMIDESFSFNIEMLNTIHHELFQDVFPYAGQYKEVNWAKSENTLNGCSVVYGDYHHIRSDLQRIFDKEEKVDYRSLTDNERVRNMATFMSKFWRVHPFREGNTRTASVFIGKYLRSMGYDISNKIFHENSLYLRCALVRANFNVPNQNFFGDYDCLIKFFDNLMYHKNHLLDLRDTVVKETFVLADGSGYDIPYEKIFEETLLKQNDEKVMQYHLKR